MHLCLKKDLSKKDKSFHEFSVRTVATFAYWTSKNESWEAIDSIFDREKGWSMNKFKGWRFNLDWIQMNLIHFFISILFAHLCRDIFPFIF